MDGSQNNCKNKSVTHLLDSGGDLQAADARCGKLAGVYVGNFPHSCVNVLQILSLHHQNGLSRVEVELGNGRNEKHVDVKRTDGHSYSGSLWFLFWKPSLSVC